MGAQAETRVSPPRYPVSLLQPVSENREVRGLAVFEPYDGSHGLPMQTELCPSLKGSPVNNVNTLNILDLILGGDNGSFGMS